MSFGNKGGGSRNGRQYPEQVTTSLTAEHYAYLQLKRRHEIGHLSLADVMRECIERCQVLDATALDKAENVLDAPATATEEDHSMSGRVPAIPL